MGDNGGSAEGGLQGTLHDIGSLLGMPEPTETKLKHLDNIGTINAYAHYNAGWAWATNSPFPWTKTVASHLGGTRNPMIISWPKAISDKGALRSQFGHVTDITPTILDAVGLTMPKQVNGITQMPFDGQSLTYSFSKANLPEKDRTQYFEIFGHRAVYHKGWMASAFHTRLPWGAALGAGDKDFALDKWELYDLRNDFSQSNDIASKFPSKLIELQQIFHQEAARNKVLPLKGQQLSAGNLPSLGKGATSRTYYAGSVRVPSDAMPSISNTSWSLAAGVNVQAPTTGIVAKLGSRSMGWALYFDADHRPTFTYKLFDIKTITLKSAMPLPSGKAQLNVDFQYDGTGWARGGTFILRVNGIEVGRDSVPVTPPALVGASLDIGIDMGSPVGDWGRKLPQGFPLTGAAIDGVTITKGGSTR